MTPDLVDCGYETDATWEAELEGVEPDRSRSRYPEKVYWLRRFLNKRDAVRKIKNYLRMSRYVDGKRNPEAPKPDQEIEPLIKIIVGAKRVIALVGCIRCGSTCRHATAAVRWPSTTKH